jgi:hypothetical protein
LYRLQHPERGAFQVARGFRSYIQAMLPDWRPPTRYSPYTWCVCAMMHRDIQQRDGECTITSITHDTRTLVHRMHIQSNAKAC